MVRLHRMLALALIGALLCVSTPGWAMPRLWDGGPGGTGTDWHTPANWNPDGLDTATWADDLTVGFGTPTAATNVNVMNGGSVTVNAGAVQWNGRFNSIGHASVGSLTVNNGSMTIGWTGSSALSHGINIGNAAGGNGVVVVNDGALTFRGMSGTLPARIGQGGAVGLIEQNGGTVTVNDALRLGGTSGSGTGTYRIRGGALDAKNNIHVGSGGSAGTLEYIGATATVNCGANFVTGGSPGGANDTVSFQLDGPARRILAVDRFANLYDSTVRIAPAPASSIAPGTEYTLIEADLNKTDAWNASLQASSANYVYHPDLWDVTVNSGVAGTVKAKYVADPGQYGAYYDAVRGEPGLVAYYRLNETSGTTARDLSLNPVDGTYRNSPTLGVGGALKESSDPAVHLDGVDQDVRVPHDGKFNFGTGDFSLEAWARTTSTDQGRLINKAGGTPLYQLTYKPDGRVEVQVRGGPSVAATSSRAINTDGRWHHVVGLRDGDRLRIYVDGVERGSIAGAGSVNTNNGDPLYIGPWRGSGAFYEGSVDEVALYNNSLSETRVVEHYAAGLGSYGDYYKAVRTEPGLVGYYRLSELTGTTAYDSAPNPVDGTYRNGVTLGLRDGLWGKDSAIALDAASSQMVQIGGGSGTKFDFGAGDFSLEAWVRTAADDQGRIINKAGSGGGGDMGVYQLTYFPDGTVGVQARNTSGSSSLIARSGATVNDDLWHHVVGVLDAGTLKIYVDGLLEETTPGFTGSTDSTASLYIGAFRGASAFFDGLVDDVALYNLALTDEQILEHYRTGFIPEPATLGLMSLGALALLRRRRRGR